MGVNITSNMNLPVPQVGNENGPLYATDVNGCFSIVDAHNHTPGSGVLITPPAMNISSDLTFQDNRATLLYSLTFTPQTAPLTAATPDLAALYVAGADLYYNDVNGNQIRMTQNGGIVGSPGTISGLVPPASASYVSAQSTFVFQSAVNTPAGIDAGPISIGNLTLNSFTTTINANSGIGADYNITLAAAPPGVLSLLTMDTSGNVGYTTASSIVPPGIIQMTATTAAPTGYLLCDGTAYSRTTYAALFAAISTAYGVGDGSTTFNVPDFRGIFPRGVDNGAGNDPDTSSRTATNGGNSGDNVGSLQGYENASHVHYETFDGDNSAFFENNGGTYSNASGSCLIAIDPQVPTTTQVTSTDTGPSGGNETRPINLYVNFIIKT